MFPPNFPQSVEMGRNLCGGPVKLVCLKGPRHGSSISTRSSSSPPSYHRWGEPSSATMASTCLSLCFHASSPSSSSPRPRRSSLAFSSSSKSKRTLKVRAKALREDWRQKSKPIPPGAVYPAKDHCRYVLCRAVHSFVRSCDYAMRCLPPFLFLLLWWPKPLWALRHILRCACQDCLCLPGRRHVPCRGHLLHLNITYNSSNSLLNGNEIALLIVWSSNGLHAIAPSVQNCSSTFLTLIKFIESIYNIKIISLSSPWNMSW